MNSRQSEPPTYMIYLLTVWVDSIDKINDPSSWRFRVENPRTKQKQGSVGIDVLVANLISIVGRDIELEIRTD